MENVKIFQKKGNPLVLVAYWDGENPEPIDELLSVFAEDCPTVVDSQKRIIINNADLVNPESATLVNVGSFLVWDSENGLRGTSPEYLQKYYEPSDAESIPGITDPE